MTAIDGALLFFALTVSWSLYRAQRDPSITFNLYDLIIENGRVSKLACILMGSFVVTSWAFIKVAMDGKMTETTFLAYGGLWVAPTVAKLFSPPATTSSSSTISTTSTSGP